MKRQRREYLTRREKVVDFLIGFIGWFILNGLMWAAVTIASGGIIRFNELVATPDLNQVIDSIGGVLGIVLFCAPLLINLALIIRFAFTRYWIAIGAASAFASVLLLTICAGIVWTVACFVLLSNSGY